MEKEQIKAVPNCGNCKFWDIRVKAVKKPCVKSKFLSQKMLSSCGLRTTKDFYCNEYKEINSDEDTKKTT